MKKLILISTVLALGAGIFAAKRVLGADAPAGAVKPAPADVEMTIVAVEYEGSKLWLPGTIVAKKGQSVRLTLINNMKSEPNTHGFAIDAFGVKAVVTRGKPEVVEFTADKEGVFRAYCQLHPKHVGGQLVVLP